MHHPSILLDCGVDLSIFSKLVGHASGPAVTGWYDCRDDRAKHATVETITVPYVLSMRAGESSLADSDSSLMGQKNA